ncbi:MAG: response regulator [Gammaproteobacteria bacterium]|nr:response regulator [Gammaproteobacteria bacterium]
MAKDGIAMSSTHEEAWDAAERMHDALESARVGIWNWELRTGHVDWSAGVYLLFGYEPFSFEPSFEFLRQRCVHPGDAERTQAAFEAGLRQGRAYDIEYRTVWPNGEVHWVQSRGRFIHDECGEPIRMSGVTLDIDRLKQAEQQATEARERLRTIAEATPGTIFSYRQARDGTPSFPYATPHLRETHGIDPAVASRDPAALFSRLHPEDYEMVRATTAESARTMSMWHCQFRHLHPEKGEVWIEAFASPVRDEDGGVTWHGISHDITAVKRAEKELLKARQKAEAADRAKSEFLANMSHEIRTPMSAIMGYADILGSRLVDPDNLQCLETIRTNGHYLLEIIDDILDLSRIEAGKLDLDIKRVRPDRLVLDVQSLMKLRAADKGLALAVDFDGPLPETIETDPTRLRQILINLVENSIKFTERGEVRVALRFDAAACSLEIDVSDTGVGIEPEMLGRLFRPFTQADSSLTRRFGGSGLGLSICRELARLLGGDVTVQSRVGVGSRFRVTIAAGDLRDVPLRPAELTDTAPAAPATQLSELACRVLVVDDRREMRHLAEHMLEDAGAEVELAADGRAALERVAEAEDSGRRFDAILLDMQMPVLDGYRAATELRRRGFDRPIIALTANAMKEDEQRCLASGCDAYLAKPLNRAALIETVAACTRRGAPAEASRARPVCGGDSSTEPSRRHAVDADARKVLIVDDSPDVCAMLKLLLETAGYDVTTAADGADALAMAVTRTFDVIVLDLGLPGLSGAEVVAELRSRGGHRGCRLIGLSGRSLPERDWRGLGFDDFLQKPARFDDLKTLLGSPRRDVG